MPSAPLREEVLGLIVNGPAPRLYRCHGYANGCQCPPCKARARKGARTRVQKRERALMAYAAHLGIPLNRASARTVLNRYGSLTKAQEALRAMRRAKLRTEPESKAA